MGEEPKVFGRRRDLSTTDAFTRSTMILGAGLVSFSLFFVCMAKDSASFLGDMVFLALLNALLFTGALTWLWRRFQDLPLRTVVLLGAFLFLTLALRLFCLPHITMDYETFLSNWVAYLRANGGFSAIAGVGSDYNVPYLYILALISYVPVNDLFLIKFVSVVADVLLAFACLYVVAALGQNRRRQILTWALMLVVPTIWLNSAFWAQCDALYALFVVLAFLYVLKDRSVMVMIMLGLAFSFKLQAIFIFPFVFLLLIARKIKWKTVPVFFLTYLVTSVPALLLGKPLSSLYTIYTNQVGLYSNYLNLNSPSAYALLPSKGPELLSSVGVVLAGCFVLLVVYAWMEKKLSLEPRTMLLFAFLFVVALPWLLPSMHERYFYLADVFSVLFAVCYPKRWILSAFTIYASYAGYHAYLFNQNLMFSMWLPALLLLAVSATILALLFGRSKNQARLTPEN